MFQTFTYNFYPFLLAVDLVLILAFALPKINLKAKDRPHILAVILLSVLTLFIGTPRHIVFGEFEYINVAESLARGRGFRICNGFDGQECSQLSFMDRPPGPAFLWAVPIVFGVDPINSALFLNVILNVFSGALVYLAAKELSGSKNALAIALVFVTLVSRTKLQWTAVSEIPYLFFFVLVSYFLIRYFKSGKDLEALLVASSYLFHIRPEAFMVATPLAALISYKFYRKKEFKNDLKTALFLLFMFLKMPIVAVTWFMSWQQRNRKCAASPISSSRPGWNWLSLIFRNSPCTTLPVPVWMTPVAWLSWICAAPAAR